MDIFDNMTIKIFLMRQNQWGRSCYNCYSEKGEGRWKDLESIDNYKEAEYLIYINRPDFLLPFNPEKTFCFTGEPDEFYFTKNTWQNIPGHKYIRPVNHWHSFINYTEFKNMKFPDKTRNLCWVTTSQGDENTPSNIQITEGQRLRMQFLKKFLEKHPNKMYLYGRNLNKYYTIQDFQYCGGVLTDLWDGIKDYRYSLAFETSYQPGYFCKLYDPILAGCMPIYWGCPDLENYLPKNSFYRVDLRKDIYTVCDEIIEIINSDLREQHLDELQAAKELLLDKWNIWNVIYEEIVKKRDEGLA